MKMSRRDRKNEEQLKEEFLKMTETVIKFCGTVSPDKCKKGKCIFSNKRYGCICEAIGMNSPYDWNTDMRGEEDG